MRKILVALLSVFLWVGCSKKESENSPPPASPTTKHTAPVTPLPPSAMSGAQTPPTAAGMNAEVKVSVQKMETEYINAPDPFSKIVVLNQIPDAEPTDAMAMLGRLFQKEEDTEMREEILHSLLDIDGEDQAKLNLLTLAVQADQPQSVRLTGIDSMTDLENSQAIPILQNLLMDSNAEIRDAAEDAVDQLKDVQ